jgi:hypothetical protein
MCESTIFMWNINPVHLNSIKKLVPAEMKIPVQPRAEVGSKGAEMGSDRG